MTDVQPPHDLDAEHSVLGAILLAPDAVFQVSGWLLPEDFYRATNAAVYKAALRLAQKGIAIDNVTLASELEAAGMLDRIGGRAQLMGWQSVTPTARNIGHYATIVREKANLWRLQRASTEVVAEIAKGETFETVFANLQDSLVSISRGQLQSRAIAVGALLDEEWERLSRMAESGSGLVGIPTGYVDLDRMIGGLEKDDLVVVAGRPSMGKTALALNMAVNFALAGRGVLFFSLEMSRSQLMERLLALVAGIDAQRLHRGILNPAEMERVSEAAGPLSTAPLYIDDNPLLDEWTLVSKARNEFMAHAVELIVVDYLQLMEGRAGAKENRTQEVSGISRALKRLARQVGAPVVAISQLSRKTEEHPDKKPWLSDLRESGQIEADADIVLLLWREDYYKEVSSKKANICEINVAKQRRGPTGAVHLHFNRSLTKFSDLSDREETQ